MTHLDPAAERLIPETTRAVGRELRRTKFCLNTEKAQARSGQGSGISIPTTAFSEQPHGAQSGRNLRTGFTYREGLNTAAPGGPVPKPVKRILSAHSSSTSAKGLEIRFILTPLRLCLPRIPALLTDRACRLRCQINATLPWPHLHTSPRRHHSQVWAERGAASSDLLGGVGCRRLCLRPRKPWEFYPGQPGRGVLTTEWGRGLVSHRTHWVQTGRGRGWRIHRKNCHETSISGQEGGAALPGI